MIKWLSHAVVNRIWETVNGMNICVNCGSVHGYVYVPEYFDFMVIYTEYEKNRYIIGITILIMCWIIYPVRIIQID